VSIAPESLCDLIETRSAQHLIPQLTLWKWTFAAILDDVLVPYLSGNITLDTEFVHGGQRLTWRRMIFRTLPALERRNAEPKNWNWTGALSCSSAAFDKWLGAALRNHRIITGPKRRAGAKGARERLAEFIAEAWPDGVPPSVGDKKIAEMAEQTLGKRVSARTVARARGRK